MRLLEKYNLNTFKKIEKILQSKLKIQKITFSKFNQFKDYANYLGKRGAILPLINGGQSPGTIFLNLYIKNIQNEKRFKLICILIKLTDFIGFILWKLKIIRILEKILIMIFKEKIFLKTLSIFFKIIKKVINFLRYRFSLIWNFILFRK